MNYEEINEFGRKLAAHLPLDESAILVSIGATEATPDCRLVSAIATVRGRVGMVEEEFTGNAINLADAVMIARGKLRDARAAHHKKQERAKKEKAA